MIRSAESAGEMGARGYEIMPLGVATWEAFVALAEKHYGVWGRPCTWFHSDCASKESPTQGGRCGRGASCCARPDREDQRRPRRGICAGRTGQEDFGLLLYTGTRSLFEQADFVYERSKEENHCVMCRTVSPAEAL